MKICHSLNGMMEESKLPIEW